MRHPIGLSRMRLALLPLLLAVSCTSYLPFTERVADRYRLEPQDRPLLQYFVSDEFCLRRDTTDESARITAGGTIRYFRGRRIEELRIPRRTPGVAVSVGQEGMGISFIPGDDGRAIAFAPERDSVVMDRSDEERTGRFAAEPKAASAGPVGERFVIQEDSAHSIRYDGKRWTVHYERRPYLLIRARDVEDQETRVKTLPGRKVDR